MGLTRSPLRLRAPPGFAEQHDARADDLEERRERRYAWWEHSEPVRVEAAAAMTELDHRGLPPERSVDETETGTDKG